MDTTLPAMTSRSCSNWANRERAARSPGVNRFRAIMGILLSDIIYYIRQTPKVKPFLRHLRNPKVLVG
jgi:hypothetical protein